jgi:hypothetical protein
MTIICPHCQAQKWPGEPPGICCLNGKIKLPQLKAPPKEIQKLLTESTPRAMHFRQKTWQYNMAFAMISFGADKNVTSTGFFTTFQIQGQRYHRIGSLLPPQNEQSKFMQVYFLNGNEEMQQRCRLNAGLRPDVIQQLQDILHESHPYVADLKYALEQVGQQNHKVVIHADRKPPTEHSRRFNAPTTKEVAILMTGQEHGRRDIILRHRDSHLSTVTDTHRYDHIQQFISI